MDVLRLYWLGPPLIELRGKARKLETRKCVALLAYLSLSPGLTQRETLAAMFWPESTQRKALGSLRRTLASLRSDLPGWIEADREAISLKRNDNLWIDVDTFHQVLGRCQAHACPQERPCDACMEALKTAIELYRADFTDGLNLGDSQSFEEWQFFQRDSLHQEYAHTLQRLSSGYAERAQWEQAILSARRWVVLDRLHEPACRTLMGLYVRSGQRSAACRQYEELAHLLHEELGQEPERQTRELYEQVRGRSDTEKDGTRSPARASIPFLKTKLYVPGAPSPRVIRSTLIDSLREAEKRPLTIVSAPAGFGKTTLLAEWIGETALPVAWLSLDQGDNEPYRFLLYLTAALESVHEGIGAEAEENMRSSPPAPPAIVLTSLLNEIGRVPEHFVLVLDDYQFISEHAVHDLLAYLFDHLPSNLHVVIATRSDPPIPLGRMRAHGELLELRTQKLRFTLREAAEFLNGVMALGLSANDVQALETRTEGWVVGLQLAALSLRGQENAGEFIRAFSGSHRYILDYLVEEVLKRQPSHIQTFLLETSVIGKLTGSLCDALMSDEWKHAGCKGQELLEYLEGNNLFLTPLDDRKQWYRYHHLFADLLRSRLQQLSGDRALALHAKASQWFEDQGLLNEAIEHALLSKDFERSANLLDQSSQTRVLINVLAVQKWIEQIPEAIIRIHPWIHVARAWILLAMGRLDGIESWLTQAEDCISGRNGRWLNETEAEDIRGHVSMIRAYLAFFRGEPRETIEQATLALENVRQSNDYLRSRIMLQIGESYSVLGELQDGIRYLLKAIELSTRQNDYSVATVAYFRLGTVFKYLGRLSEAERMYRENLQALKDMGGYDSPMLGKPEIGLGDVLRERGELQAARELLIVGHIHSKLQRQPYDLVYSHIFNARLLQAEGKDQEAVEELAQAEPLFVSYTNPPAVRLAFDYDRVKLWLRVGKLREAETWVSQNQLDPRAEITYGSESNLISLARILTAQGKLAEARKLLDRLAIATHAAGRNGRLIEILVLQTLVLELQGHSALALDALRQALRLAEPEGYLRIFLDEGRPLIELLQGLGKSSLDRKLQDYVHRLLEACAASA